MVVLNFKSNVWMHGRSGKKATQRYQSLSVITNRNRDKVCNSSYITNTVGITFRPQGWKHFQSLRFPKQTKNEMRTNLDRGKNKMQIIAWPEVKKIDKAIVSDFIIHWLRLFCGIHCFNSIQLSGSYHLRLMTKYSVHRTKFVIRSRYISWFLSINRGRVGKRIIISPLKPGKTGALWCF